MMPVKTLTPTMAVGELEWWICGRGECLGFTNGLLI